MKYKYFFFICWIALRVTTLPAQIQSYSFNRLTTQKGLSNSQVNCIMRDSQGFTWIGTSSGLNRFDGYSCRVFRYQEGDTTTLSNNFINHIYEGPEGMVWINTTISFTVYDPVKDLFYRNPESFLNKYSIPNRATGEMVIVKDRKGDFWFLTADAGLIRYASKDQKTYHFQHQPANEKTIGSDKVAAMAEDSQGNYWLLHKRGTIEKLDGKTYQVTYRSSAFEGYFREIISAYYYFFIDTDGDLWLSGDLKGLFYFNTTQKTGRHIHSQSEVKLNNDKVSGITQDNAGLIWIGTDHGGINLLNKKTWTVEYLLHNALDEKSLSQNSITTLYKDPTGIIWAGTYTKGANFYHENMIRFPSYRNQSLKSNNLPNDEINCVVEDQKGNLWLGTNGAGLLYFERSTGRFTQWLHQPGKPSISSNVIVSLHLDHQQKLWIGTYLGGLNCFDGKKFVHYQHNPADPASIGSDNIWQIYEDSQHTLWLGTLGKGLDYFDREKNRFYHYNAETPLSIHSNDLSTITEDQDHNLWIGTSYGIDVLDRQSGRFTHYVNQGNEIKLSGNTILSLLTDSRGLTWVGTRQGLTMLDKQRNVLRIFHEKDGLPTEIIQTILEDDQHQLWLGTANGLSRLTISPHSKGKKGYSFAFKTYTESDGLPGNEFTHQAAHKTHLGELIFGGTNGFTIFTPSTIEKNQELPKAILTEFQLFNQSVSAGDTVNDRVLLPHSLNNTSAITLFYRENAFSIEFAAISYFQPGNNKYRYQLEGFDQQWIQTSATHRKATYTNLNPGEYTFRVKVSNNDGIWNEQAATLKVVVLPPFWKTRTAYVLLAVLIVVALLLAKQLVLVRERMHFQIEHERNEVQRLQELDLMKTKFFTNVSHEFKTPLSLILTPVERMLEHPKETDLHKHLPIIHRNARRLLNLVTQLLDFRKMEMQQLKFQPTQGDIALFIQEVTDSFSDISEKKNIPISFHSNIHQLYASFDQDKLEKVLFNLLSNAFKFTPGQGKITVDVHFPEESPMKDSHTQWLRISVRDTGIGIPAEKHERIFDRFFQNNTPDSVVNQGNGIGLAIAQEFVRLHGGTIQVESEPEKGSSFSVLLPIEPIRESILLSPPLTAEVGYIIDEPEVYDQPNSSKPNTKPVILLVEDNEDFRFYLKDNLRHQYHIVEATHGIEAWQLVHTCMPDLIVSDIMMPKMDGIEFCRKIKQDVRLSHIPLIFLTAKDTDTQKLEGFESGAVDYITKPFNFEILQASLKKLLSQQSSLRKSLHPYLSVQPSTIDITSKDEQLIQQAIKLVEQHISEPNFSVEMMSQELAVSRAHLYRKMVALTGKTPIEFIRFIRLQRAAQLLEKSQQNVSEIAYKVGFNNPRYFAKHFKMLFNMLPSVYASKKQNQNLP